MNNDELISTTEILKKYRISRQSFARMIKEKKLSVIKKPYRDRNNFYFVSEVEKALEITNDKL